MFWMFFITEVMRRARDSVSEGKVTSSLRSWVADGVLDFLGGESPKGYGDVWLGVPV